MNTVARSPIACVFRFCDDSADSGGYAPLDLALELGEGRASAADQSEVPPAQVRPQSDELLLDADRLAEEDAPLSAMSGRRRGLVSSDSDDASATPARAPSAGSTLFERMANLSRGGRSAAPEEEEDGDDDGGDDGSAISIPRFLGRQNNQ